MLATMTPRERILAAIKHEEVDRIPCAPRIGTFLRSYYGDAGIDAHIRAAEEFGFDIHHAFVSFPCLINSPLFEGRWSRDVYVKRKIIDDGIMLLVRRTIHTPAGALTEVIRVPKYEHPQFRGGSDPLRIEHMVKDADDIERLRYILSLPDGFDIGKVYRTADEKIGERGIALLYIYSPITNKAGYARGVQNMMLDLYDDPVFFHRLLDVFHEEMMSLTRIALEAGIRHIFGSWFFESLSVGWSPDIYRKFFLPRLREHVALVHEYDGIYTYYDDGKMMTILEDLACVGVDVVETLTPPPLGDVDIADAKRRVGEQICLKGHIDCVHVILHGTPQVIERKVREAVELAGPTGFILGTSDSIRPETPLENVRAYFDAAHRYCTMVSATN